jgi:D-aspartate ligase
VTPRRAAAVDASTPVVLLKLSDDPLPHGALGAARSLGRAGVAVHVLSVGNWRALGASRHVVGGRTLDAGASDAEHVAAIDAYASAIGGPRPVLLCTTDTAALLVDANADALAHAYRFPRPPIGVAAAMADKGALAELCAAHGVPTARTVVPRTLAEAHAFAADTGFPVMVKAADPRRIDWSVGHKSAFKVADAAALDAYIGDVHGSGGVRANVLLQEFVPGGSDTIWFFHGYFDERSTCRFGFVGQKLREHPPGAGATTLAVRRVNDAVRDTAMRLLQAIGYRGIVDAELRFDAATGRHLVLDLNPRAGANFRLFVTRDGLDVVRTCYLDLTGQPVPATADADVRDGRRFWVESYDPATWTSYFGSGTGTGTGAPWRQLPASLRGVRETAWFALDDPVPFLVMLKRRLRG